MSSDQDQARLIAERVARSVTSSDAGSIGNKRSPSPSNGAPVHQELSAIREGLHDLENKLARIESKIVQGANPPGESRRARVIDFVSPGPPIATPPAISISSVGVSERQAEFIPPTHSPWVRDFSGAPSHPSQERFGVEEAAVSELVEFFETEKKCSVEPGGKPCDHCSMCSSRGF